jgi:hypothetical protein
MTENEADVPEISVEFEPHDVEHDEWTFPSDEDAPVVRQVARDPILDVEVDEIVDDPEEGEDQ